MDDPRPPYPSHFVPRTRVGKIAVFWFLALLALAEPPLLYLLANRVEPWLGGLPFLYAWLLVIYWR